MEERVRYHRFGSEWLRDRHITLVSMKPGHLIRINKNNKRRYLIRSVERIEILYDAVLPVAEYVFRRPEGQRELWVRVGPAKVNIYRLCKISDKDINSMLMQTKFFLEMIDVVLPSFETKEQSSISFEDA